MMDIIVTSGSPVGTGGQNNQMEDSIGDELKKLPGVEEVLPNRTRTDVDFRNVRVAVSTTEPKRAYELELNRMKARLAPEVVARRKAEIELYQTIDSEKNTVIISGKGELKSLKIDPSLFKEDDVEILEDLIVAAHKDAKDKAEAIAAEKTKALTADLPIPPGFKLPF